MGEIADSLLDGEFDYITGEYIGEGVGYPRSFHDKGNRERFGGIHNPKHGVTNWLNLHGVTDKSEQMAIIRKYTNGTANQSKYDLCMTISKDFGKFIEWFKQNNQ